MAAFQSIKSFIEELKQKYDNISKINVLFTNFMVSKYGKLTIQPTVVIVNNNQKIDCNNWLNTSLKSDNFKHGKVYSLDVIPEPKQFNELTYYPQYCREVFNEKVVRAVKSKSDEELSELIEN